MNSTFLHLILVSSNYYHRLQLPILLSASSEDPRQTLTRKNAEIVEDLFRLSSSLPDFILDLLATLNFWISSQFRIFRPFCRILEEAATALSREN